MNWRWPESKTNRLVPWWRIGRRIVCLPLLMLGIGVALLASLLGWGVQDAKELWMNCR